jgi:hypothetical protein
LKPELLLLALCTHATKHNWHELKWLVDIAALIERTPELDWEEIYRVASRFHLSKQIDLCLALCARALNAPISCNVGSWNTPAIEMFADRIIDSWFESDRKSPNLRDYIKFQISTFDSASKRLSFLLAELTQPDVPTYLQFPLPETMFPLYRLLHPARLATCSLKATLTRTE